MKPYPHETITRPASHYLFVEKVGPFQTTAMAAWKELHATLPNPKNKVGSMALYKMRPEMVYRAGWALSAKPESVPAGFKYEEIPSAKFEKFTYTGPYDNLGQVSGDVWEAAKKLELRDGWAIENYVNDPATTPPEKLITEIMVPVK